MDEATQTCQGEATSLNVELPELWMIEMVLWQILERRDTDPRQPDPGQRWIVEQSGVSGSQWVCRMRPVVLSDEEDD